jgi:hypothetical protein
MTKENNLGLLVDLRELCWEIGEDHLEKVVTEIAHHC